MNTVLHVLTTEKILKAVKECKEAEKVLRILCPDAFSKTLNIVTQFPTKENPELKINGVWVADIYKEEEQGNGRPIQRQLKGKKASMYLDHINGTWYAENGEVIIGYLYYEPNEK